MADALVSGTSGVKSVSVRVRSRAQKKDMLIVAYPFFISRRLLLHGNLGDAAAMTASLEVGFKKSLHNLDCLLIANEATGHCEHVGIIVHTRKACNFGNPAECRANAPVDIRNLNFSMYISIFKFLLNPCYYAGIFASWYP